RCPISVSNILPRPNPSSGGIPAGRWKAPVNQNQNPKRQRTATLQEPGGNACGMETRASFLECGCPLPLSAADKNLRAPPAVNCAALTRSFARVSGENIVNSHARLRESSAIVLPQQRG